MIAQGFKLNVAAWIAKISNVGFSLDLERPTVIFRRVGNTDSKTRVKIMVKGNVSSATANKRKGIVVLLFKTTNFRVANVSLLIFCLNWCSNSF